MQGRQDPAGIEGLDTSSSSPAASSIAQSCRIKRAIVVGKGGSQTPVPTCRTTPFLPAAAGTTRPVSARKLAAALWEMNGVPSPMVMKTKDEMSSYFSDPSQTPVSLRRDRSGPRSFYQDSMRPAADHNVGLDSLSLVESVKSDGVRTRLKDISTALTTSKGLLKIIDRIWAHEDAGPPSSSVSLISALRAELERARMQVHRVIQEQRPDKQSRVSYLMQRLAEEKANAMQKLESELDVERKLRRRSEGLNKKLCKELSETEAAFFKAVQTLECEKRTREIIEQTYSELVTESGGYGDEAPTRVKVKDHLSAITR
ncbi:unnamed protein product [Cuscuta campestris]|uniref:Uncharacterized protein n=1 Tax=Cuscuta campestris TaxID=132261 RepID=A0A484KAK1_9ASTE|nr:unnamed protein product [Cuscuta campestris]